MEHIDFVNVVASMDVNMQVSLSETFNIVTADAVINDVPVVTSKEINWVNWLYHADPNSSRSIKTKLNVALQTKQLGIHVNKINLTKYNERSKDLWLDFLN